ncbi:MAG: hypothetical protein IJX97_03175 [Clostridia bacterium]|nr:hypothetical protein [Clostridia bacterium]
MYCIKCGVKLSEGQTVCPLCETKVYHPDVDVNEKNTFPKIPFESEEFNRRGLMFVLTMIFLVPLILPIILELSWHSDVSWSGYASGGTLIFYVAFVMPYWFKKPNPVIFVPTTFALAIGLLLFICLKTGGNWFMTFAFPVAGGLGIIITAATAVLYYVKKGCLYTVGGTLIALGLWTVLLEYDIRTTFAVSTPFYWSLAPLTVLSVVGLMLIVIAMVKPLKESLRRIFFIGKVNY